MNRFKPYANSSATLRSPHPGSYDEWRWPCGCTVFSDYGSIRLYPCTSSDCIRDAETPWVPPAAREEDKEYRCTECLWTGNARETGLWTPPSSSAFEDADSEPACPACRSNIEPNKQKVKFIPEIGWFTTEPTKPKVISDAVRLGWCIGCRHYNPSYGEEAFCDHIQLREPVLGFRRPCREIRAGYTDCPYFTAEEKS